MNGPSHYREAEKLLLSCQLTSAGGHHPDDAATYPAVEYHDDSGRYINTVGNALAAAQVHATLALTAAAIRDWIGAEGDDPKAWTEATS